MLFLSPPITVYILAVTFLLGACLGSFLNCAAWRAAHHESVLKGRSHCATCGHPLAALDLIPLFSWLFLRGRCRYCGDKVSWRYPAAELLSGLIFVTVVLRFDVSWRALEYLILACVLFFLALVDWEIMELPGWPMIVAAASWLAFLFTYEAPLLRLRAGLIGGLAVGGGVLVISLVMDKVLGRETLGGGDIKLLALTGLYLGWAGNLLLLILACLLGLILAVALRAKERPFPFGPAIALAVWPAALLGEPLIHWYMGLFF